MGMVLSIVQFSASKLQKYIKNPSSFKSDLRKLEKSEVDKSVYLDKSWEAIHFILTGNKLGQGDPPLSLAIYSRQFFDEKQDLGIGPASYLSPELVKEVHLSLEILGDNNIRERYKPSAMNKLKIYGYPWGDDPIYFKYLLENFQKLKVFYKDAESKGYAVAAYLS